MGCLEPIKLLWHFGIDQVYEFPVNNLKAIDLDGVFGDFGG